MQALPESLSTTLDPGDSILLLCPPFVTAETTACTDLHTLAAPVDARILSILYTPSPDDRSRRCEDAADAHPADVTIVDVAVDAQSTLDSLSDDVSAESESDRTIERVSSPTDLTGLGVVVTNQLDDWDTSSPDTQVVGCFHSLTALLQYVSLEQTFKFVDVLRRRLARADAITHFHMDPAAHDTQTISRLSTLFDTVVEYHEEEWTITTQ